MLFVLFVQLMATHGVKLFVSYSCKRLVMQSVYMQSWSMPRLTVMVTRNFPLV